MSKVLITKTKLDNLAVAVSAKSGATLPLTIAQMQTAVEGIPSGGGTLVTKSITQNGTYDAEDDNADGYSSVTVNVPSGTPTLQTKSVSYTPTESQQTATITADSGYDGLEEVDVTVGAISSTYVGSGITQRSSSDLSASGATVTVPSGYYSSQATKSVSNGSATPASSISATGATVSTGTNTLTLTKSVSNTPQVSAGYVSSGTAGNSSVSLTATVTTKAAATYTPTESTQTISANQYLTGAQTIGAISSTYVGSGITQRSSSDLTASGATVTVPSGYYASQATKSVASGTAGTPTATKGTVSNHSVSVTPSVTNTTGYITGSTKTGTAVTVSASELVSGTLSLSDIGTSDCTNYASVSVSIPFVTYYTGTGNPSSSQGSNGDIYLKVVS